MKFQEKLSISIIFLSKRDARAASPAGKLRALTSSEKPRDDALAVISLNLDRAVLRRSAAAAELLERLRRRNQLVVGKPVNNARAARPPPLAGNANHSVLRKKRRPGLTVARALRHQRIDCPTIA